MLRARADNISNTPGKGGHAGQSGLKPLIVLYAAANNIFFPTNDRWIYGKEVEVPLVL